MFKVFNFWLFLNRGDCFVLLSLERSFWVDWMVCLYLNRIKTLQFYSSVFSLMQTFLLGVLDLCILSRCSWHNSKLPYCTSPSHTAVQHPHSQILLLTVPVSRYFFHQNRDQLLFGVITATSQQ